MRAGIIKGKLNGPFELQRLLNGEGYFNLLQYNLNHLLDDVCLETCHNTWHDGAPPHYVRVVRVYINQQSANHWFGSCGTIRWPP